MKVYELPQNRMRKARDLAECYWILERLKKDYSPVFDQDPMIVGLMKQLSETYDGLVEDIDTDLEALIDHGAAFRIEIEFDPGKVAALGYSVGDVHRAIKRLFGQYGLPCVTDGYILAITDRGHKDDFSNLWIVLMDLARKKWFQEIAISCFWFDGDGREDVLAEVKKLEKQRN